MLGFLHATLFIQAYYSKTICNRETIRFSQPMYNGSRFDIDNGFFEDCATIHFGHIDAQYRPSDFIYEFKTYPAAYSAPQSANYYLKFAIDSNDGQNQGTFQCRGPGRPIAPHTNVLTAILSIKDDDGHICDETVVNFPIGSGDSNVTNPLRTVITRAWINIFLFKNYFFKYFATF